MTDIFPEERFDEDQLRRLGLYVERTDRTVVDGPMGPVQVMLVEATIGDVAFTDRVIDPAKNDTDTAFREMEAAMLSDEFLDQREQIKRNIAAGRDPLDNGDETDDVS